MKRKEGRDIWLLICGIALIVLLTVGSTFLSRTGHDLNEVGTVQLSVAEITEITTEAETLPAPETTAADTEETETEPVTDTTETTTVTETMPTTARAVNYNLNTANADDLQTVTGIGEALAAEIIAYRTQHGGFSRRSQLLEIPGIGEKLAGRIMAAFFIPNELPPETVPAATAAPVTTETLPTATVTEAPAVPVCYDLNTVTREELLTIPGMTELLSDEILELRTNLGGYQNVYELMLAKDMDGTYLEYTLKQYLQIG